MTAHGTSAFMGEILQAVADEVSRAAADVEVITHAGYVDEVVDESTVAVVVPHEYFAVAPDLTPDAKARTIAFGVEHPGTETFHRSSERASELGGWFEIGPSSVAHLARRGLVAHEFPLGYVSRWDHWQGQPHARPVDVTYLGTADPRRLGILAHAAPSWAGLRTELLTPPHEPMVGLRDDFLTSEAKWRHLADSKVLVNLHRDDKTAFEWVRALEAMINGCVVVTEPSTDLGPLVPGQHIIVSPVEDIGPVVASALADQDMLERMARAAYDLSRDTLNMAPHALALVEKAKSIASWKPKEGFRQKSRTAAMPNSWAATGEEPPMAVWVPTVPNPPAVPTIAPPLVSVGDAPRDVATVPGRVTVLCAPLPGDGPVAETTRSIVAAAADVDVLVGERTSRAGMTPPHRGHLRNLLVERVTTPYVAVLDGGDGVLGDGLARMAAKLDADPQLDAVVCPATYGSDTMANALPPELRRLEGRAYLSRGFLVRTSVLRHLGGFTEDPELSTVVDHHFWLTLLRAGGRAGMLRHVGIALWPRTPDW